MKRILDACCGSKMFYFDKNNPDVLFCDIRSEEHIIGDNRKLNIKPDVKCDFTNMPFSNESFNMVVFDPPHLTRVGKNGWQFKKYGVLSKEWEYDIIKGFNECFRVLKKDGTLIFKWNETHIKTSNVLQLTDAKPILGHRSGKASHTHWICFIKGDSW